nr:alpha/beta hydrolase [Candidatus Frankia alpina]
MPLDPQIEILLKQWAAEDGPAPDSRTVADNRAAGRAFATLAGDPEPVADVRDTTAAADDRDIPVRIYRSVTEPDAVPLPVTLFFHGGGWVFGDLDTQDHMARAVAGRSGTIVVSVDYRLAPEHRFPAATDDAYAGLSWVADNAADFGGDAERIAVFGESAGGNLAAALTQESLRRGGPRITLQVLAYPAVDRFDDSPSMYENMTGPVLSRSYLEWFWGAYLSTPDQGADPRVSPARCDELAGLPPRRHRHHRERPPARPGGPLCPQTGRRRRAGPAPPGQGSHPRVPLVHRLGATLAGHTEPALGRRGHSLQLTRPAQHRQSPDPCRTHAGQGPGEGNHRTPPPPDGVPAPRRSRHSARPAASTKPASTPSWPTRRRRARRSRNPADGSHAAGVTSHGRAGSDADARWRSHSAG